MLKSVIIGFGGIAKAAHVPNWKILEEKGLGRLVACYDIDASQFLKTQVLNIGSGAGADNLCTYTEIEELLEKETPDVADICAPTPAHAQIAADLLRRGIHVHCEKPMARTFEQCQEMIDAAKQSGAKLMIGQCLRFFAPYVFLKDALKKDAFGKPHSAMFQRLSAPPTWGWDNWFMDGERSGGCLLDLHIHDLDALRFIFGEPGAVSCVTKNVFSGDDIVHSRLLYDDLAVLAIGDWSLSGYNFEAGYRVGFEKATVVFNNGEVTVFPCEGEPWKPELSDESMYMKELEYFLSVVIPGGENTINTPESASQTVRLAEVLKQSAGQNGAILPY